MKRLLFKSFIHLVVVVIILYGYSFFYDAVLPKRLGPTTQQQITASHERAMNKKYVALVLGNSRIYRGINPDQFQVATFNFAHDDDSYNQIYFKLAQAHQQNNFNILILGVDYFSFSFISDRRNYVYGKLLGEEYLVDYYQEVSPELRPVYFYWSTVHQRLINYAGFDRTKLFIRSIVFGANTKKPTLKTNGQYIYPGRAKVDDSVKRECSMLDIQKMYFEKIIDFCHANNITIFLVMPPTRENELANYKKEVTERFNRYFSSFNDVTFLNFSTTKGFELKDFTDITHLNAEAADRFSRMINDSVRVKMSEVPTLAVQYAK